MTYKVIIFTLGYEAKMHKEAVPNLGLFKVAV